MGWGEGNEAATTRGQVSGLTRFCTKTFAGIPVKAQQLLISSLVIFHGKIWMGDADMIG